MLFRLVLRDTEDDDKYLAIDRYEFLGNRDSIWFLWFNLTKILKKKHVEVFNLEGLKVEPEKGSAGLYGYSL